MSVDEYRYNDHDPAFVRGLGQLTMQFANLEQFLREAVSELSGTTDQVGEILTAGMSFPTLVDKYCSLCLHWLPAGSLCDSLTQFRIKLQRINERRNTMIHCVWVLDVDTGMSSRDWRTARAKNGLQWQGEDVPLPSLLTLVTEINAATEEVFSVANAALDILDVRRPGPRRWSPMSSRDDG